MKLASVIALPKTATVSRAAPRPWFDTSNAPWYTIHLLTNPFSGGTPEMAAAAMAPQAKVTGSVRASPPSSSISSVPDARETVWLIRNRFDL